MTEKPYIAPPDRAEVPPMNELVCFYDKDRGCGPDCMSFSTNTPGEEYREPWAHCIYLTSLFRISKHVVILAKQGDERLRVDKMKSDDAVRVSNDPAVTPFTPPQKKST